MIRHINVRIPSRVYNGDPRNIGEVVLGLGVDLSKAMDDLLSGNLPQSSSSTPPVYNGFLDPGDVGSLAPDDFSMLSQGAALAPLKDRDE